MIDERLAKLVEECVRSKGQRAVEKSLASLIGAVEAEDDATLTIVANAGVHAIPSEHLRGEVYSASYGNWDVSSQEALEREFKNILNNLGRKLKERSWSRIYLIPTGHPALSIHIKQFVYRVTRMNTIDLVYLNGRYYELSIDHREVLLESREEDRR